MGVCVCAREKGEEERGGTRVFRIVGLVRKSLMSVTNKTPESFSVEHLSYFTAFYSRGFVTSLLICLFFFFFFACVLKLENKLNAFMCKACFVCSDWKWLHVFHFNSTQKRGEGC